MADVTETPAMTLKEFLESVPPGQSVVLHQSNFDFASTNQASYGFMLKQTPLYLHCGHDTCRGMRVFEPDSKSSAIGWHVNDTLHD